MNGYKINPLEGLNWKATVLFDEGTKTYSHDSMCDCSKESDSQVDVESRTITEHELASSRQVSGKHYKEMAIQPAEFCQKNKLGWCESNVIKYVCRHKHKNKKEDIMKAMHYLQLLIEWEYSV